MFYEVFIPARDSEEFDTTITVEAGNWMVALKSGLDRTGQLGDGIRNVMCDIKDDNSIHVTDGASRRVFILKEVDGLLNGGEPTKAPDSAPEKEAEVLPEKTVEPKKAELPAAPTLDIDEGTKTEPMRTITESDRPESAANVSVDLGPEPEPEPVPEPEPLKKDEASASNVTISLSPQTEEPIEDISLVSEAELAIPEIPEDHSSLEEKSYTSPNGRISIGSATYESLQREEPDVKVIHEARAPSGTRPAVVIPDDASTSSISQNILEDVFLEMQQIHEGMEMEQVIEFVMNISMEKIRAEAGSIMFADISGTELYFAAARGPKADDIMDFRIPMGVGIVGFCVREGVSLAIGDVEKDPRFYKAISEKLGYETRNLCCVPIQHEGRVYGAIELMNKKEVFATQEVNALTYIGSQMARYIHDLIMAQEKI